MYLLFQRQVTSTTWKCVLQSDAHEFVMLSTLSFQPQLFSRRNLDWNFECLHRCPCRPNFGIHLLTLKDAEQMFGDDKMSVL